MSITAAPASPLDKYDDEALQQVIDLFDSNPHAAYDLVLLLTESRPGVLLSPGYCNHTHLDTAPVQQVLDALALPHLVEIENKRYYDDIETVEPPRTDDDFMLDMDAAELEKDDTASLKYFVARDTAHLHTYPPHVSRHFGEFLGYPEDDIEAFNNDETPFLAPIPFADFIDKGYLSQDDLPYAALPHYDFALTEASVTRYISRGKDYYAACKHFDEYCNTDVAVTAADERIARYEDQLPASLTDGDTND